MSSCLVLLRPLIVVLCAALLGACAVTGTFAPIQGPLAAQRPIPTYPARFTGAFSGHVDVTLGGGERFTGSWQIGHWTDAPPGSPDFSHDWDLVYGAGYYRAHVIGAKVFTRVPLAGSAGSTAVAEFANERNLRGETRGLARDSLGNLYKVSVYN
jgi:hypothetical protein